MQTYEVTFQLETGRNLNILIAASDETWATSDAAVMLREVGVYDGEHYDAREVTAKAVDVRPVMTTAKAA